MKYIFKSIFILFTILTFANGQHNLPKNFPSKTIKGKDHQIIYNYFTGQDIPPTDMKEDIPPVIIKNLPKEFQKGCKEMISGWGSIAKGKDSIVIRALTIKNVPEISQNIFFGLTCFSTAPGFGDKFYDERLMVISIRKDSSTLSILHPGKPCSECNDLTKLALEDDTLMIAGIPTVTFYIESTTNNPCCENLISIDEISKKYYTVSSAGVNEVLSIILNRNEIHHNKILGDSTRVYDAQIDYDKDNYGYINRINIHHKLTINDSYTEQGIKSYLWNKKARRFEEGAR
ncbi:MAG: hypothetical protein HY964_03585 [Ignavibacteriales bacterium]|nr:hypothetical protein [Ignavibacteriales bacterium]